MKTTDFARYLTDYLSRYLPNECGASPNTVQTYGITFALLLEYMKNREGISPDRLHLPDITKPRIVAFLGWLETERGCGVSTRNARLSTLLSFFRYIQYRDMKGMATWQDILSIRFKKCRSPEMAHLSPDGMKLLLLMPDTSTRTGRRDLAMLGLLYDSAARVQELADLTPSDFRFEGVTATVRLRGKGSKSRIVPLSDNQVKNLRHYMQEHRFSDPHRSVHPLFGNPQGNKLSRVAILGVVKKYAGMARVRSPLPIPENIGCHSLRHSKAMHMLEAGINLVYIRDFLGHASVSTTEIYARASEKMKLEALKKVDPSIVTDRKTSWQENGKLLDWLKELRHKPGNIM